MSITDRVKQPDIRGFSLQSCCKVYDICCIEQTRVRLIRVLFPLNKICRTILSSRILVTALILFLLRGFPSMLQIIPFYKPFFIIMKTDKRIILLRSILLDFTIFRLVLVFFLFLLFLLMLSPLSFLYTSSRVSLILSCKSFGVIMAI